MSNDQAVNEMRRLLLDMADNMAALLDSVDGYKAQLEQRGYSPTAAETMAIEYHHHLLAMTFAGTKK